MSGFGGHFSIFYSLPEAPEAFKNLPGARGFVLPKYEPVASHGGPVHASNYRFSCVLGAKPSACVDVFLEK